jgi:Undecaprenyl-phosphate glucose phosphotransferase
MRRVLADGPREPRTPNAMDQTNPLLTTSRRRTIGVWHLFGGAVALAEGGLLVLVSVGCGTLYHLTQYATLGDLPTHLSVGAALALIFVTSCALQGHYRLAAYIARSRRMRWPITTWAVSVLYAVALGFLVKAASDVSRGTTILLALFGLLAVVLWRRLVVRLVALASKRSRIAARRVLLIGSDAAIDAFVRQHEPWKLGFQIVARCAIGEGDMERELDRAAEFGRTLEPDDVFIVLPWSDTETIERIVDRMITLPAAIHLGPERILDRFREVHISKVSSMATLCLVQTPLSPIEVFLKRSVDVIGSGVALLLLSPLLLLIAVAIKLDSKGPVLFRQLRFGFNQKPFWIIKFRTMVVHDSGGEVPQAQRDDPRLTAVGRHLRRWNLDELPQLINVLLGDMSLVGPRPHAVPHNLDFERRIVLYARRHNVKPGLTGWAQVNGFRGPTDTEQKLHGRLEHDLYYIDNWSIGFDLAIIARTVISAKAYQNAH